MSTSDSKETSTVRESQRTPLFTVVLNAIVIGSVALSWSLSTQFSKSAVSFDPTHFNAPYFMMWFSTNFMLTCFPVFVVYETLRTKKSLPVIFSECQTIFGKRGLTVLTLFVYVIPFLVFWVGANYTYVRALMLVSPSVATSISACNAAIVYFLSILILGDKLVVLKLASVVFAIGGVVVISLDKDMGGEWAGYVLSFASALLAAVYKVCFKRICGSATLGEVSLFMSCLGLLNVTVNVIPPIVLAVTGAEDLEFAYVPWWPMVGSAVLSLLFNFLINFGIALLHPLVISVGMLCGIPLNTVIDILFRGLTLTTFFLIGTALIVVSFVLIILPNDIFSIACRSKKDKESSRSEQSATVAPLDF